VRIFKIFILFLYFWSSGFKTIVTVNHHIITNQGLPVHRQNSVCNWHNKETNIAMWNGLAMGKHTRQDGKIKKQEEGEMSTASTSSIT
jgi:hypothetical protein